MQADIQVRCAESGEAMSGSRSSLSTSMSSREMRGLIEEQIARCKQQAQVEEAHIKQLTGAIHHCRNTLFRDSREEVRCG